MISGKNGTSKKIVGTRKFGKIVISGKNGTPENFGGAEESRKSMKSMILEKSGTFKKLGVPGNSQKNYDTQEKQDMPHIRRLGPTFTIIWPRRS